MRDRKHMQQAYIYICLYTYLYDAFHDLSSNSFNISVFISSWSLKLLKIRAHTSDLKKQIHVQDFEKSNNNWISELIAK